MWRNTTAGSIEWCRFRRSPDMVSIDIRSAWEALGEITGKHYREFD